MAKDKFKEIDKINKAVVAAKRSKEFKLSEWYGLQSILGHSNWAMFFILLGARESGKSYSVMEYFVRQWKFKHIPFYWLRLNEKSTQKMLVNKAEKLVDADLLRKYDLDLSVKGCNVYDHGKKMATVLCLSTFYNDKGVALFDKDFIYRDILVNGIPLRDEKGKIVREWTGKEYHICLDEFQLEEGQKSQGDIAYQFVNQMENLVRSTKDHVKIFLIGNTLQEASDILTMFNFIPMAFGRYKLKKKRAIIDYLEPSEAYKERRKGTVADILMGNQSNFTNKIENDETLIYNGGMIRPTSVLVFKKDLKFTVWDGKVIAEYHGEKCKTQIAMRPYLDLVFNQKTRDELIGVFDSRGFLYKNMITFKKFQKEIQLIKPRKN